MSLNLKKSKTEHKQLKNEWEVKQTPSRNYFNYSWYPKKKKIESWTKEFESLIEEIAFCQNCRITSSLFSIIGGIQCIFFKKKKLYGRFLWIGFSCLKPTEQLRGDSSFLPLSPQIFPVLTLSTSDWWPAESTLEPPSGLQLGTSGLETQCLNN